MLLIERYVVSQYIVPALIAITFQEFDTQIFCQFLSELVHMCSVRFQADLYVEHMYWSQMLALDLLSIIIGLSCPW